jgi:amino acid adenylation domain-containing protein
MPRFAAADPETAEQQRAHMTRADSSRTLFDGFRESAERFARRTALVVDGASYSYAELYRRAGRIATAIRNSEQPAGPLAAVWAHRSPTAYAGVLGCLAAGKGYVPLNPKFPMQRTLRMLSLSGCSVIVAGKECLPQLPELLESIDHSVTVILPDVTELDKEALRHARQLVLTRDDLPFQDEAAVSARPCASSTAYLLFTSGSTGEPKGVPISHRNVRAYLDYVCARYDVNEHDRFSQQFDLTFDLSVHDMFVCWERGASLYCVPEKSLMAPAKFIRDHRLTVWFSVPSVAGLLAKMRMLTPGCFLSLRYSLFCGEPLPAAHAQAWQAAAPNSVVENLYGPTEATIAIAHFRWDPATSAKRCVNGIVPIGRVFEGQDCRVVNSERTAVPVGEEGELCLSGSQVARGYWNNPEKTQEHFVRLPGGAERTWYRTGDLVKQDAAGNLFYLGRTDHQIKVRGYRVELQEIEAVLRRTCGTEQVVAVPWPVRNGSAEGIVSFVSGIERLDQEGVLARCGDFLPEYMVPKKIFLIDELPLSANQKIDRGMLEKMLEGAHA